MADLKTTQDRRERFVTWLHMPGEDRYSVRAWATAEDACDDVEVLLRENAKLRALAYIGDHHHEDLTHKARLNELVPQFRALEAEVERLRAALVALLCAASEGQVVGEVDLDAARAALGEP